MAIVLLPERFDTWLAHFLLSQWARIFFHFGGGFRAEILRLNDLPDFDFDVATASEVGQRFAPSMASCLEFTRMDGEAGNLSFASCSV